MLCNKGKCNSAFIQKPIIERMTENVRTRMDYKDNSRDSPVDMTKNNDPDTSLYTDNKSITDQSIEMHIHPGGDTNYVDEPKNDRTTKVNNFSKLKVSFKDSKGILDAYDSLKNEIKEFEGVNKVCVKKLDGLVNKII